MTDIVAGIVANREPLARWTVGANQVLLRLAGEDTGGELSVVEFRMPPGALGAAPHIHHAHTEEFVIVSGEITFDVVHNGQLAAEVVGAGGTVSVAPEATHGFRNDSAQEATVIGLFRPAGYEKYFALVHEMVLAGHVPTPADLAALRGRFNTTSI